MIPGIDRRRAGALLVALGLLLISLAVLQWRPPLRSRGGRPALAGAAGPVAAGVTAGEGAMLRLHVLANSDTEADQALKRLVRDALLRRIAPALQAAPDAATMAGRLRPRLGELARVAQATVRASGYDYPVQLELGRFAFDTRSVGEATVPPGEYPALRVRIGAAAGHNWWCLLFPPLCFAGGSVATPLLDDPVASAATPAPLFAGPTAATGDVLLPGPAGGAPVLLDDGGLAPEARWALLDWLREHGVRVERIGRSLRLWLWGDTGRNPALPAA